MAQEPRKPMTPDEFDDAMREIRNRLDGDPEKMHYEADGLMAEVLERLGYAEGVEEFRDMRKYYG